MAVPVDFTQQVSPFSQLQLREAAVYQRPGLHGSSCWVLLSVTYMFNTVTTTTKVHQPHQGADFNPKT